MPFHCRRCHECDHVVKDCPKTFRRRSGHYTHEVRRQGREHQAANGEISSSLVSNLVGTPSPTPTTFQDSSTTDQLKSTENALTLVPKNVDEARSDHSPETTPQHLINNFLGMHVSFPYPVYGLLNTFNFILKDCIPPS
jgi:hypothetical protein